jgi:hypothetical protein
MWAIRRGAAVCAERHGRPITERWLPRLQHDHRGSRRRRPYESHPEIATEGAWSVGKLRGELARLRRLRTLTDPEDELFTSHDIGSGNTSDGLTPEYYRVAGLDREARHFRHARFFQSATTKRTLNHVGHAFVACGKASLVARSQLVREDREKAGMRAWMWSDRSGKHRDEFLKPHARSVVQSNGTMTTPSIRAPSAGARHELIDLDKAGFARFHLLDYVTDVNTAGLVDFCRKNLGRDQVLGVCSRAGV